VAVRAPNLTLCDLVHNGLNGTAVTGELRNRFDFVVSMIEFQHKRIGISTSNAWMNSQIGDNKLLIPLDAANFRECGS